MDKAGSVDWTEILNLYITDGGPLPGDAGKWLINVIMFNNFCHRVVDVILPLFLLYNGGCQRGMLPKAVSARGVICQGVCDHGVYTQWVSVPNPV